jgi:hypothetical protein
LLIKWLILPCHHAPTRDAGSPFWLGLAVTQWKCGRLLEQVKANFALTHDDGNAVPEQAFERIGHSAGDVGKGIRTISSLDMVVRRAERSLRIFALRRILLGGAAKCRRSDDDRGDLELRQRKRR